uniref:Uncharacterized protein n=1 Tax=Meloidogyne enterolobii TaxID=390850 RepID=A0A6V7UL44_MELEN|nr:unnamed protein product [Meloidogyne enterolobii]
MEYGKTTAASLILKNNLLQQNLNNKIIWRNSVKSDEWSKFSENRLWANKQPTGLWIDLQDLEFDHHWLFTKSESAERELVSAYDAWVEVHQQVLNLIKKWLLLREQKTKKGKKYLKRQQKEELKLLFNQIIERQTTLERCRAALERAWASADQTRGRFSMERIKGSMEVFEQDSKDELPPQLGIFFRSPLFVLSEKEVDEEKQEKGKLPEIERQRRQAVSDCRYQVQIFFNNLLVCSSQEHKLDWPSFSVPFGEIISLRVFEKPKQLSILLKEKFGGGNWQLLAEIFIPLPKILEGEEENVLEEDEEIIKNKWMSKTGIQFASTIVREGSLGCGQGGGLPFTQGRLFCSLKWKGFEEENIGGKRNFQKIIKRRGRATTTKSSILYQQCILKENLQKDARLLKLERRWNKESNEGGGGEEMKRILIKFEKMDLKEEEEEEETDFTKLKDERRRKMEEEEDENELERHLRLGKEFVLKLRENLRQTGEQQRKLKDLSQFVKEEPLPKFSFRLLTSLLNGRQIDLSRRLKPFRGGGGAGGNVGVVERGFNQDKKSLNWTKILLNIQSANAVPQRINGEPMQIYLTCSLKGQTQITSISDGHQPNWHETLIFDFQLNNEEEEAFLTVELFDRIIKPFEGDDREVDIRHERVENRWLGFGQILLNSKALSYWTSTKLDGYLSLQTPLFYTGFNLSSNEEGLPTTLRIRLSVESPSIITRLSASEQLQEETLETDIITTESLKLESKLRQRFPNRRIISLAINSSGKRIVICKYLREINPPIQIINLFNSGQNKNAVKLACKLVALIPLINERMEKLKEFVLPIWLTVEEAIRIGFACADELAIILCCWLLGLKLNCYIILGSTLSNGPNSAFVFISFSDGEQWIIDPTTGHHYSPTNPNCPQLSIGTIFNNKNIFFNIQNDEHPSQLNFDFTKKNNWENIFCFEKLSTTTTSQVLASIQSEYLQYEPLKEISSSFLLELRTSLERELRLAFDETRPFAIPQWNLLASRNLREFLSDLFASNFFDDENIQQQQQQKLSENYLIEQHLKPLLSSFKICLISFCLPFINKKQIIESLLRLKLQQNSHSKTQFALAVYLKPLMGSIISCSVVICTLIPIV